MSQQVSWRCKECEEVVTASTEDIRRAPACPNCGTLKEAPGPTREREGAESAEGSEAYDGRAGSQFEKTVGPELDRLLARRVLGGQSDQPAPPYSSEDLAATALAELVGRQSGWSFHLAFCGDAWIATFTEKGERKNDVPTSPLASLVSATGRSRSLAICRALLKVTRSPRWSPLGTSFLRAVQPSLVRAAGFEPAPQGFATS